MGAKHWYRVTRKDGNTELEGTCKDICEYFKLDPVYFYQITKYHHTLKDQYKVIDLGLKSEVHPSRMTKYKKKLEAKKAETTVFFKPEKPKKETKLEKVKRHLDIYGNTITYKNPVKLLAELKKIGYEVRAIHEPRREVYRSTAKKPEIYSECWILELLKREKIGEQNNVV